MNLTVKQLIQQNNAKRELLNTENKTYYEELLLYIRASLFRDERATEEVLYEMLDHLILAQEDQKTATEVFGKEPMALADEIIATIPLEKPKKIIEFMLEIGLNLIGIYCAIIGIGPMITQEEQALHLGNTLLTGISLIIGLAIIVYLFLRLSKKGSFQKEKTSKKPLIQFGISFGLVVAIISIIGFAVPSFGPKLIVGPYTYFGFGCFLLLASYLLKKMREAK